MVFCAMTKPVRLSRTLKTAPLAPSPKRERISSLDLSPDHERVGGEGVVVEDDEDEGRVMSEVVEMVSGAREGGEERDWELLSSMARRTSSMEGGVLWEEEPCAC